MIDTGTHNILNNYHGQMKMDKQGLKAEKRKVNILTDFNVFFSKLRSNK
jgi:hypothetical protein